MLEYMLVRTQDSNILQASQGKLEWIVLDEAHTYLGSQAAELALLIRRVMHAFDVNPEKVRFVATSATIGNPQGEGGERLRDFLSQVAGVHSSRVTVVVGTRKIPTLSSGSQLDDADWPFGSVYLAPRNHCVCGAPAYELLTCSDCGSIFLTGEERRNSVLPSRSEAVIDEFELDLEQTEEEVEDVDQEVLSGPAHGLLIANRPLTGTGIFHVHRETRRIVEATDPRALSLVVYESAGRGMVCPACAASGTDNERNFRKARIGAPFLLGGLLPTLLEFASDGEQPADRPYRARKLLTFSDTRQGTARLAAKLQQDAERTKVRGLVYHHALAKALAKDTVEIRRLQEEIEQFESVLATLENGRWRTVARTIAAALSQLNAMFQSRFEESR